MRNLASVGRPRLLIGETATDGVVMRARAGEFDIVTANPPRLIHGGHLYALPQEPTDPTPRPASGRAAWARWAIERYLVLATEPARQGVIADVVQTTQQSVSNTARHLTGLVRDNGEGLVAENRAELLDHWLTEYVGPRGLELGWYGQLDAAPLRATRRDGAQILHTLRTTTLARAPRRGSVAARRLPDGFDRVRTSALIARHVTSV